MIETAAITAWRHHAPWQGDEQVEQDLVLSRALIEIFSDPVLQNQLAFRGGTALNKLYLPFSTRYSEDLDFVQVQAEPIGETIDRIRDKLDPWLGSPKRKRSEGRVVLTYRFVSESLPHVPLRLKVEINIREHFSCLGYIKKPYEVNNSWFSGQSDILCFALEELLGTKLRALYQRKKGRDLYDLYICKQIRDDLSLDKVYECFLAYMKSEGNIVTRAQFEENMYKKLEMKYFLNDIKPLLQSVHAKSFEVEKARLFLENEVFTLFSGEPWKHRS